MERISIDEAFLDVTGSTHLFGPPAGIAAGLRARVRREVGLPISIGAARTKHLAKVASQVAKPDGLVVVEPAKERAFLDPLPVGLMWGVGRWRSAGWPSAACTRSASWPRCRRGALEGLLGHAVGLKLAALAVNEDPRRIAAASGPSRSARSPRSGAHEPTPNW